MAETRPGGGDGLGNLPGEGYIGYGKETGRWKVKRLAFVFVLLSTNAFADDGIKYFSGSNGERGMFTRGPGGITYYDSNRGSGMGSEIAGTIYWHGHAPGGGKKCDTRMEWCD